MDINRNQVFVAGLILLCLGLEFRLTDSFVLTSKVTKMLAEQTKHPVAAASNTMGSIFGGEATLPPQSLRPPEWIGWALLSAGSVLILHCLTMAKPG